MIALHKTENTKIRKVFFFELLYSPMPTVNSPSQVPRGISQATTLHPWRSINSCTRHFLFETISPVCPLYQKTSFTSLFKTSHTLILKSPFSSAKVIFSENEAAKENIDHDDSHAMKHGFSFSLLIHGIQPANSPAAKAISALKASGDYGYGVKADKKRSLALVGE